MAPALQFLMRIASGDAVVLLGVESAWETQASWRHGRFGAKPASHGFAVGTPKGSDFAPRKVGDSI
jgi:hypothetical protein